MRSASDTRRVTFGDGVEALQASYSEGADGTLVVTLPPPGTRGWLSYGLCPVRAWPGRDSREGCRGPNVGLSASDHPSRGSVWQSEASQPRTNRPT
jgi:hypothetical protein